MAVLKFNFLIFPCDFMCYLALFLKIFGVFAPPSDMKTDPKKNRTSYYDILKSIRTSDLDAESKVTSMDRRIEEMDETPYYK